MKISLKMGVQNLVIFFLYIINNVLLPCLECDFIVIYNMTLPCLEYDFALSRM